MLRQVFRKTGKALDQAAAQISSLKHERDQFAAALEHQKPQKRRKVNQTAQERFVSMLEVRNAKAEMATSSGKGATVTARSPSIATDSCIEESESEVEEVIVIS